MMNMARYVLVALAFVTIASAIFIGIQVLIESFASY